MTQSETKSKTTKELKSFQLFKKFNCEIDN